MPNKPIVKPLHDIQSNKKTLEFWCTSFCDGMRLVNRTVEPWGFSDKLWGASDGACVWSKFGMKSYPVVSESTAVCTSQVGDQGF